MLRSEEHDGFNQVSQTQMQGFREVVDVCCLVDLGFQERPWTFEKKVAGGSFTRVMLDRALRYATWCAQFPLASIEHLTAMTLDHSPILLNFDASSSGARHERDF